MTYFRGSPQKTWGATWCACNSKQRHPQIASSRCSEKRSVDPARPSSSSSNNNKHSSHARKRNKRWIKWAGHWDPPKICDIFGVAKQKKPLFKGTQVVLLCSMTSCQFMPISWYHRCRKFHPGNQAQKQPPSTGSVTILNWDFVVSCSVRAGWQYIDPKNQIQGPFSLLEMQQWCPNWKLVVVSCSFLPSIAKFEWTHRRPDLTSSFRSVMSGCTLNLMPFSGTTWITSAQSWRWGITSLRRVFSGWLSVNPSVSKSKWTSATSNNRSITVNIYTVIITTLGIYLKLHVFLTSYDSKHLKTLLQVLGARRVRAFWWTLPTTVGPLPELPKAGPCKEVRIEKK